MQVALIAALVTPMVPVLVLILSVVVTAVVACCVALVTFARNWSKGFEDDGGTKMVINGTFSTEYYVTCWTEVEWPPCDVWKLPSFLKLIQWSPTT